LKSFATFLADETDEPNALSKLAIPKLPTPKNTPTAKTDDIDKLLASITGTDVWSRRDHTIICTLQSTGARRSEVARMRFDHLDLDSGRVIIPETKNGDPRLVRMNDETKLALRRYLRALDVFEDRHRREGAEPELWCSKRRAPLTSNGIEKMFSARSTAAGVKLTPHSFRRSVAVDYLAKGGSETYLMKLMGWKHRDMVKRYTEAVAVEEALRQHELLFP
jgi:integrase/recombinase XerD